MKDREPRQFMGDGPAEKERALEGEAARQFVQDGIDSYSVAIARYSLVPTPTPDWRKAVGKEDEIAEFLSEIRIDDETLAARVGNLSQNPSPELVAEAASVTIAQAKLRIEEAPPKVKTSLEKFSDRILEKTGNFIAGRGGKKALAATLIPVLAAACSSPANAVTQPRPIDTQESVATEVFTPTPEITPTPTLEPTPTVVAGQFEYDFQPDQPGYIPAELAGAGGTGKIVFNIAESAGGEISTDTIKEQGYVPLVVEGRVLSAEVGNASFLPYPETMLFENESGQLEELTFSLEHSGPGYAAYIDSEGAIRQRMLTLIPTPESGTLVAAVSFNEQDRGTVYVLGLSDSGSIMQRVSLVFDADTEIRAGTINGNIAVYINGERISLGNREFETLPQTGIIGSLWLEMADMPEEMATPLSTEQVRPFRFTDTQGNPLPYGIYNIPVEPTPGHPGLIVEFHVRLLGRIPPEAVAIQPGVDTEFFLFDIPIEMRDLSTGELVETGERQFGIFPIFTNPLNYPPTVAIVETNNIDSVGIWRRIPPLDLVHLYENLPMGSSIIVGFGFHQEHSIPIEEDRVIASIQAGWVTSTMRPFSSPLWSNYVPGFIR